jgi:hypothetical protein
MPPDEDSFDDDSFDSEIDEDGQEFTDEMDEIGEDGLSGEEREGIRRGYGPK